MQEFFLPEIVLLSSIFRMKVLVYPYQSSRKLRVKLAGFHIISIPTADSRDIMQAQCAIGFL